MKHTLPLRQAPEKICILRLSALGDVTHVVPVVRAIQAQWPGTEITWVCGALEKKLLAEIPNVRFIVFDKKQGWRAYLHLRKALRHEMFDVLLHMQVAARANLASLFIKAHIRLGWDRGRARDLHHWFIDHQVPKVKYQHQVEAFLSFATTLGVKVSQPVWDFPLSADAISFADAHIAGNAKTLLISPCSSHSLRNWNIKAYAAVADYAIDQLGMQVVLSGGPSKAELEMAQAIEAAMQQQPVNLVGKDTLQQLMAMLKKVDVVISPDSGPAHMANAMGTPVIGLYACTWSRRSGPYNSLDICVDKFERAAKIYTEKTAQELRWGTKIEQPGVMDLIHVDEVIDKLQFVIKNRLD